MILWMEDPVLREEGAAVAQRRHQERGRDGLYLVGDAATLVALDANVVVGEEGDVAALCHLGGGLGAAGSPVPGGGSEAGRGVRGGKAELRIHGKIPGREGGRDAGREKKLGRGGGGGKGREGNEERNRRIEGWREGNRERGRGVEGTEGEEEQPREGGREKRRGYRRDAGAEEEE